MVLRAAIIIALLVLGACERKERGHPPLPGNVGFYTPLLQADLTRAEGLRGHRIVVLDEIPDDAAGVETFRCDGSWGRQGRVEVGGPYTIAGEEICVQIGERRECRAFGVGQSPKTVRLGSLHYRVEPIVGELCGEGDVLTESELRATLVGATMSYNADVFRETFCADGRWIMSGGRDERSVYEIRGETFCVDGVCRQLRRHGERFETTFRMAPSESVEAFMTSEHVCN